MRRSRRVRFYNTSKSTHGTEFYVIVGNCDPMSIETSMGDLRVSHVNSPSGSPSRRFKTRLPREQFEVLGRDCLRVKQSA